MVLSLVQAAKVSGKSKSTINRSIKSGKLSAQRHDNGSYSIDPAELFRVFPKDATEPSLAEPKEPIGTPSVSEEVLRVRVQMLEAQLEREQETVADLRKRLDRSEDRVLALSHQLEKPDLEGSRGSQKWGFRALLKRLSN